MVFHYCVVYFSSFHHHATYIGGLMEIVLGFVRDYYPPTWALLAVVFITGNVLAWSLLAGRQPQRVAAPGPTEEIPAIYTSHDVMVGKLYPVTEYHPNEGSYSFQKFEVLEKEGGRFRIGVFSHSTPSAKHCFHAFGGWAGSLPSDRIIHKADLSPD